MQSPSNVSLVGNSEIFGKAFEDFVTKVASEIRDNGGWSASDDLTNIVAAVVSALPGLSKSLDIPSEFKDAPMTVCSILGKSFFGAIGGAIYGKPENGAPAATNADASIGAITSFIFNTVTEIQDNGGWSASDDIGPIISDLMSTAVKSSGILKIPEELKSNPVAVFETAGAAFGSMLGYLITPKG